MSSTDDIDFGQFRLCALLPTISVLICVLGQMIMLVYAVRIRRRKRAGSVPTWDKRDSGYHEMGPADGRSAVSSTGRGKEAQRKKSQSGKKKALNDDDEDGSRYIKISTPKTK